MLTEMTWVVVTGLIVSMILAMAVGANDVGNFFGTSVGAGILNMKQAYFLATIMEISGAVLLGEKVSDTIWKSIIDYKVFNDQEKILMLGNLSALIGCSLWMIIATRFRLPVSATHSIVGATVGYAMVVHGSRGVKWMVFAAILGSWLASPILAGILSIVLLIAVRRFLLKSQRASELILRWLPVAIAIPVMINVLSILFNGPNTGLSYLYIILITVICGFVVALLTWALLTPRLKRSLAKISRQKSAHFNFIDSQDNDGERLNLLTLRTDTTTTQSKVADFISKYLDHRTPKNVSSSITQHSYARIDSCQVINVAVQTFLPELKQSRLYLDLSDRNSIDSSALSFNNQSENLPGARSFSKECGQNITSLIIERVPPSQLMKAKGKRVDIKRPSLFRSAMKKFKSPKRKRDSVSEQPDTAVYASSDNSSDDDYGEDEFNAMSSSDRNGSMTTTGQSVPAVVVQDQPSVAKLFAVLQIVCALFGSFTHGFNDVSNAIAPFVAVWMLWVTELNLMGAKTPLWILLYGGSCISIGIWLYGHKTITTIGSDITSICPSNGFVVELCSALAVLIASNLGFPVSSTHCKVGSVVCVGRLTGAEAVNWKLVRNIAIAWAATFPVTAIFSATVMTIIRRIVVLT